VLKNIFVLSLFLILPAPVGVSAEELLPAICRQVLEPDDKTTVTEIIRGQLTQRAKELPGLVINEVKEAADAVAESVAGNLESYKNSSLSPRVLGTSTASKVSFFDSAYDEVISGLAFLIRHWFWTFAGLGLVVLGWFLRF